MKVQWLLKRTLCGGLAAVLCGVLWAPWVPVQAAPLTLDAALATLSAPHPEFRVQQARESLAQAERDLAESLNDFRVTLEASVRSGTNPVLEHFSPDHLARLNVRKTLLDSGQVAASLAAALDDVEAAALQRADVQAQRRVGLMARFFDVLLADFEYAANSEFMAVAYVRWDDGKQRLELGQISAPELALLEARYQELRSRRNDSERRVRDKRSLLANAMNRPGDLPSEVADPNLLSRNNRALPEFDALLVHLNAHNPRLAALRKQLEAARQRMAGVRASSGPRLEFEAEAGAYSRDTSTRDTARGGVNLVWPIYQGRRTDGELVREQARFRQIQADYDWAALNLRQALYETWQEIQFLRDVERKSVQTQAMQRDWALERARAEYELELKTNLGTSMAETQTAKLKRRAVEFQLALAWARLDALLGVPADQPPGHIMDNKPQPVSEPAGKEKTS